MKISSIICEYNPFHNGHLYAINKIKSELKPDAVVCIMSGNFTQRGEAAVMDKYTRAKHAVKAGADMVLELPAAFATAPAEIFAKGAIKLLSALKAENTLCFGVESGNEQSLFKTAAALSNESKQFKADLKEELARGSTLAKAKYAALEKFNEREPNSGIDLSLVSSPNNILALEYARAILEGKHDLGVFLIERSGNAYHAEKLKKGENPSAAAIRAAIDSGKIKRVKKFVPPYVFNDLPSFVPRADDMILTSLLTRDKKEIKEIFDCTEGLENRIKVLCKDSFTLTDLLKRLATRRYTQTRLSRITLSALLGIKKDDVLKFLKSDLYLKVLAINASKTDLLSDLSPDIPFITRKSDANLLKGAAKACFETDVFAGEVYSHITKKHQNEFATLFVENDV